MNMTYLKGLITFAFLFFCTFVSSQIRYDISSRLQKCLEPDGDPIMNCWIATNINGEADYISTQQAIDTLLKYGLRDTLISYVGQSDIGELYTINDSTIVHVSSLGNRDTIEIIGGGGCVSSIDHSEFGEGGNKIRLLCGGTPVDSIIFFVNQVTRINDFYFTTDSLCIDYQYWEAGAYNAATFCVARDSLGGGGSDGNLAKNSLTWISNTTHDMDSFTNTILNVDNFILDRGFSDLNTFRYGSAGLIVNSVGTFNTNLDVLTQDISLGVNGPAGASGITMDHQTLALNWSGTPGYAELILQEESGGGESEFRLFTEDYGYIEAGLDLNLNSFNALYEAINRVTIVGGDTIRLNSATDNYFLGDGIGGNLPPPSNQEIIITRDNNGKLYSTHIDSFDIISSLNTGDILYVSINGTSSGTNGDLFDTWRLPAYADGTLSATSDLVYGFAGEWTWGVDIPYDVTNFQDHLLNKPGINNFYFEKGTKHVLNDWGVATQQENYISDGNGLTVRDWNYPLNLDYYNLGEVQNDISTGGQRCAFSFADTGTIANVFLNRFTGYELLNVQKRAEHTNVFVNDIFTSGADRLVRIRPETGTHYFGFNTIRWNNPLAPSGTQDPLIGHNWQTTSFPDSISITIEGGDVYVNGSRGGLVTIETNTNVISNMNYSLNVKNFIQHITTPPTQNMALSCSAESIIRFGGATSTTTEHIEDSDIYIEIDNVVAQEMVINVCELNLVRTKLHIKINNCTSFDSSTAENPMIRIFDLALLDHSTMIIEGNFHNDSSYVIYATDPENVNPSQPEIDSTSLLVFKGRYSRRYGGSPVILQGNVGTGLTNMFNGRLMFEDATFWVGDGTSDCIDIGSDNVETIIVKNVSANTRLDTNIIVIGEPIQIIPQQYARDKGVYTAEEIVFNSIDSVYILGDGAGNNLPPVDIPLRPIGYQSDGKIIGITYPNLADSIAQHLGVYGLTDNQVLTGGATGLIDQQPGLTYDDVSYLLQVDSAAIFRGIVNHVTVGLTPTYLRVKKDGYLEFDIYPEDAGQVYMMKMLPLQGRTPGTGNPNFNFVSGSTWFDGDTVYQAPAMSWGFNAGQSGREDNTKSAFHYTMEFFPVDLIHHLWELHLNYTDSLGNSFRVESTIIDMSDKDSWYKDHVLSTLFGTDPNTGNRWFQLSEENTNSASFRLLRSSTGTPTGIQMSFNGPGNALVFEPLSLAGEKRVYFTDFNQTNVDKLRIQTTWGTTDGSSGLSAGPLGYESLFGGVIKDTWQNFADSLSEYLSVTDHDIYEIGTLTAPNSILDNKFTLGNFAVGVNTTSSKFHVRDSTGLSNFRIEGDASGFPRIYLGGSSGGVASVFTRINDNTSFYFGEDTDDGGIFFRGKGGIWGTADIASGTQYAFIGNLASNATANKARLALAPHGGFSTIAVSPYVESYNDSNEGGLAFGTYADGPGLTEKMRIKPSGQLNLSSYPITGSATHFFAREADDDVITMTMQEAADSIAQYLGSVTDLNWAENNLSQTGNRSHDQNGFNTEVNNINQFALNGLAANNGLTFINESSYGLKATDTDAYSSIEGQGTGSTYALISAGDDASTSSSVTAKGDGTVLIFSTTSDYVIGDGLGGNLPPSGDITDSIQTINTTTGEIRLIHPGLLVGTGSGVNVEEDNSSVQTGNTTLDFQTGIDATADGATEANVSLDFNEFSTDATPEGDEFVVLSDGAGTQEKIDIDDLKTYVKAKHIKGLTMSAPTSSENIGLFYTDHAITITRVSDAVTGTSPSVTYNIRFASTRNEGSPTDVFSSAEVADQVTGSTTTTFNDATIPANQWVWLITSATSGTVTDFNMTIQYTEDQ